MRPYRNDLTAEEAREVFVYDPLTGVLTYRRTKVKARAGAIAGYERPDGYRLVCVDYKRYLAHRVAWLIEKGQWPDKHLDHIDQNPRNNVLSNLRECDDAQNAQNLSPKGYGTSGYLGVTRNFRDHDMWDAKIKIRQKTIRIGVYRCKTAAYAAYCKAKVSLHTFATGGAGSPAGS